MAKRAIVTAKFPQRLADEIYRLAGFSSKDIGSFIARQQTVPDINYRSVKHRRRKIAVILVFPRKENGNKWRLRAFVNEFSLTKKSKLQDFDAHEISEAEALTLYESWVQNYIGKSGHMTLS